MDKYQRQIIESAIDSIRESVEKSIESNVPMSKDDLRIVLGCVGMVRDALEEKDWTKPEKMLASC